MEDTMKKNNGPMLDIKIDKALVTGISISLSDNGVTYSVSGSLYSVTGKEITDFNFRSKHWETDKELELPLDADVLGRRMFEVCQKAVIDHINGMALQLEGAKQ